MNVHGFPKSKYGSLEMFKNNDILINNCVTYPLNLFKPRFNNILLTSDYNSVIKLLSIIKLIQKQKKINFKK